MSQTRKIIMSCHTQKDTVDRKFKKQWIETYPFVRYDQEKGLMFCVDCESAKRVNIWTEGCDKMKTDAIKKHIQTKDHQFALTAKKSSGNLDRASAKAAEKDKERVIGIMSNLYYLAQRNEPSSAITDLNKLLLHHKVSKFIPLEKSNKSLPYEHHESVREMQEAMASVVREDLLEDIRHSGIYSLMVDESTDVSTDKTLVMYIRYFKSGQSQTKFLELTELKGDECKAVNICESILTVLERRNINIMDMCCITTDGASVMTGIRGGVTTLLKQRNQQLLSVHCIAHRLALASGQAADKIKYLKKYQATINAIFKYYHYSPKHQGRLDKIQAIFNMATRKFQQTFHTRWLSFEGAVEAILANYDALIMCLEMDVAETDDPTAYGLLKFVSDYQFLAVSNMLADILSTLGILSRTFQMRDLNLCSQNFALNAALSALRAMKTTPGPKLKSFTESLPPDYESGFERGSNGTSYNIKCSIHQINETEKIFQSYLEFLLSNLEERFTDSGTITLFSVLDPTALPSSDDSALFTYGNMEIKRLGDFYSGKPVCVNKKDLEVEWPLFKFMLSQKFRGQKFSEMATKVLSDTTFQTCYPNILKLLKICVVLPVSSADCERGFSRYNLIKTKSRNRLEPDSVNRLLMLTVDTPGVSDIKTFPFERAFNSWTKMKSRRISAT